MTPERFRQISAVFHDALARDAEARAPFLDEVCGGDETLRAEVIALLEAHHHAGQFGARPVVDLLHNPTDPDAHLGTSDADSVPGIAEPGMTLGGYRIERPLGRGGMGVVYLAYDTTLHRQVALKVVGSPAGKETARARLLREARNAAALNHPNICTIHEVGDANGSAFIAMEYVDGRPLSDRLADGALPVDDAIRYAIQIADALAYAHDNGVIHRDLKAANVMVRSTGSLKLVDFGLARRTDALIANASTMGSLAPAGVAAGTPYAMAPEQVRGAATDAKTDIWALGVLLYQMVKGATPFAAPTIPELFSSIMRDAPAPLPDGIPIPVRSVIERCLEKAPERRYQHAREVCAALEAIRAGGIPPRPTWRVRVRRRPWVAAATGAVAVVTLLAGANVGGVRERLGWDGPLVDSIAVLPLQNLSGDPDQDYFTDGMQQALITELAKLPGFQRVIARASTLRFKHSEESIPEIAGALTVGSIVTGSVRRTGDHVQITAQLIDAASERQLWGDTYERGVNEVLALQNDVVAAIARAIELRLTPDDRRRLSGARAIKPATYEAYLRGMFHLGRTADGASTIEDRKQGLAYLQEAIDSDPGDAHAYAGLAAGYAMLGHGPDPPPDAWPRARAAALRAVTLAPDLADAHAAMADVKLYYERDWAGAERAFQRANQLNPNLAMNRYHYAWYLTLVDRLDEAIAEHKRAQELDPLTLLHTAWLGQLYTHGGRYDEAMAEAKKSLDINENFGVGWFVLGEAYTEQGRHDEAIAAQKRAAAINPSWSFALGYAYARAGRIEEARQILAELQARPTTSYNAYALSGLHAALGDLDEAFKWIAYEPHHAWVSWARVEPHFAGLWDDPRFPSLMDRMKLPQRSAKAR